MESGKKLGLTFCLGTTSSMGSGLPGLIEDGLRPDLCRGRWRSWSVQHDLPVTPRIRTVT